MTEMNQDDARNEALQRVIERVNAWQESATEGTVREELDRGLREAGIALTDDQRDDLAARISDSGEIDVARYAPGEGGPA